MDIDIVKRFIYGAKEAYKKVDNHSYNFPITIESAYRLATNIETLLKEQEAVEPYMDYDGQDVWRCGKCGNSLMHPSYYESDEDAKNHIRYCSHCGRKVKWE